MQNSNTDLVLNLFFKTVIVTLYWQKYGLGKKLQEPLFKCDFKSMTAKKIFNEITNVSDEFSRVRNPQSCINRIEKPCCSSFTSQYTASK